MKPCYAASLLAIWFVFHVISIHTKAVFWIPYFAKELLRACKNPGWDLSRVRLVTKASALQRNSFLFSFFFALSRDHDWDRDPESKQSQWPINFFLLYVIAFLYRPRDIIMDIFVLFFFSYHNLCERRWRAYFPNRNRKNTKLHGRLANPKTRF